MFWIFEMSLQWNWSKIKKNEELQISIQINIFLNIQQQFVI